MTENDITPRRVNISTHVLRRTARRSKRHVERQQELALRLRRGAMGGPPVADLLRPAAERAAAALGAWDINPRSDIKVERAVHERAKWKVVAVG